MLFAGDHPLQEADFVVAAFGVNSTTHSILEDLKFGYRRPRTVTTAIAEIHMERSVIEEHFGNSINLFLLPVKNLKFAAMIPKGTHVTICILGNNLGADTVSKFLKIPVVGKVIPDVPFEIGCRCLPKMNVGAPRRPFRDRLVVCGDAGSSRLLKDGIGAAYIMGKEAAKTAVFHGVGEGHFREFYWPVYRGLVVDNRFGRILFSVTDLLKRSAILTKSVLAVVEREQADPTSDKLLSSILWDMFTGNERYKKIFYRGMKFRLLSEMFAGVEESFLGGER